MMIIQATAVDKEDATIAPYASSIATAAKQLQIAWPAGCVAVQGHHECW
jgi:hypothetical protein